MCRSVALSETATFLIFFLATPNSTGILIPQPGVKPVPAAVGAWTHALGHEGVPATTTLNVIQNVLNSTDSSQKTIFLF